MGGKGGNVSRIATLRVIFALLVLWALPALAVEVKNDGWPGAGAAFQAGFVPGDIGAVRLTPAIACPCDLNKVSLLFGGTVAQETITLNIYDDGVGATPGSVLFSQQYQLTGNDSTVQDIDLSGESISVSGPFRVGIQFQHSGTPSIARDSDGTINATENFIFTGGTWFQSNALGVTGDWIIRATVGVPSYGVGGTVTGLNGSLTLQNNGSDDLGVNGNGPFTFPTELFEADPYLVTVLSEPAGHTCTVSSGSGSIAGADVLDVSVSCVQAELSNDGWQPGSSSAFQAAFVPGEIAAARFVPQGCPCDVENVLVLFGGSPGNQDVTLRVWDDTAGTTDPGAEIYSGVFNLVANDNDLTFIDLSGEGISVGGTFRVGLEFSAAGLPSIARDDDGTLTPNRNFARISPSTWFETSSLGITGDWILRVGLGGALVGGSIWEDQNGDGLHGVGEPPLVFLPVHLLDEFDTLVDVTFTDLAGNYSFDVAQNLAVRMEFPTPNGYFLTTPDQGLDDNLDSDANQITGRTPVIAPVFQPGDATDWSAGFIQLGPCFPPRRRTVSLQRTPEHRRQQLHHPRLRRLQPTGAGHRLQHLSLLRRRPGSESVATRGRQHRGRLRVRPGSAMGGPIR